MLRFLLTRLAGALVVLAIVAVLVFALTRLASGDPVALLLGDQATTADIAKAPHPVRPRQAAERHSSCCGSATRSAAIWASPCSCSGR